MLSQFTIYTANDPGAPALMGMSGSLITVLDAVLVNGYGNKASLGWLKPIPNDPSSSLACYKQPSGSGMTLFVNDASPISASNSFTREAWVTGYEHLLGLTSSFGYLNGTGYGQFPYDGQSGNNLPSGSLCWRKSATTGSESRYWVIAGDAYTFYMWVAKGDGTNYVMYAFGDIFSLKTTNDAYKCILIGRLQINATNDSVSIDPSDVIMQPDYITYPHYMARCAGGGGRGVRVVKVSDSGKCSLSTSGYTTMAGLVIAPNPIDGSIFISPIWISEVDYSSIRGRLRGVWFPAHTVSSFGDGQIISGTGEMAGKQFMIVQPGGNSGQWAIEISATVETNDV